MSSQSEGSTIIDSSHTSDRDPWQVRLTVVWRDEEMPVEITDETRAKAHSLGVRVSTRPGSCVAYYNVSAGSVRLAVEQALDRWNRVVAEAGLPRWEIVSFSVDQIDPHDISSQRIG